MKTRTLYLSGALILASLAGLVMWSLFAGGEREGPLARGAQSRTGARLDRIQANENESSERPANTPGDATPDEEAVESEPLESKGDGPAAQAAPATVFLSGTVIGPDGLPVVGANVRVAQRRRRGPGGGPEQLQTDAGGRFQAEVRPGGAWLQITADGYVAQQQQVDVPDSGHDMGDLRLSRGATLVGRVTDAEGRPVADAQIRARGNGRGRGRTKRSDASGAFELTLREGVYRLSAEAAGFVRSELDGVPVSVEKGGQAELVLQRGGRLRGTVWRPDGKPQPSAQVFAYREGERLGSANADEEGRFAIDGIEPGPLEVFARSEDREFSCRVPIQISAVEQLQDVVLHESAKILGQVRTPDGSPRPGLQIRAVEVRGDVRRQARSDEQGRFAIEHLYPGLYRLEVVRPGRAPIQGGELEITRGEVERDLIVPRGARVAGRVRTDRGEPLEGAGVFAIRDGTYLGNTETNDQGEFEIEELPAGSYRLFVRGEGDSVVSLTALEIGEDATLEGLALVARPPARLRGRVVGPSGEGLAGISVRLNGVDSPVERRARTKPDGTFELGPLYDGDYTGELTGDALKLLEHKLGRDVEAPEIALTVVNGRDVEQVWAIR